MTNTLLSGFAHWFTANQDWLTQHRLVFSLSEPSAGDKPGQYADIDRGAVTGRVTLWASGECDLEALDVASGAQLFWTHQQINSSAGLDTVLRRFMGDLCRATQEEDR